MSRPSNPSCWMDHLVPKRVFVRMRTSGVTIGLKIGGHLGLRGFFSGGTSCWSVEMIVLTVQCIISRGLDPKGKASTEGTCPPGPLLGHRRTVIKTFSIQPRVWLHCFEWLENKMAAPINGKISYHSKRLRQNESCLTIKKTFERKH